MDSSIIDVTGQSFSLSGNTTPQQKVPHWRHQYVYSFSEIETATKEQRRFYKTYKANFFNGIFMDLEGNTNYAFILLFDLLNEYENHRDIGRLEKEFKELGLNYPKTKTYCVSFLIKKLDAAGKQTEIERIRREEDYHVYDTEYWKLGSIFKTKLDLDDNEVLLLNKLSSPNNNFFNIEFCGLEVVKLHLIVIKRLDEKYQKQQSSLDSELRKIADILSIKHFKYRRESPNYNYSLETIVNELHANVFKYTENAVREYYGHKRKLNTDMVCVSANVDNAEYLELIARLVKILAIYTPTLPAPDRNVEIELNAQNPARWKIRYEEVVNSFKGDYKQFVSDIVILGTLNKRNPGLASIFYEAAKFISQYDKVSSLKLYIYYLHHDLRSVKFDNKPFAKTVQKNLFTTNEQLHDFQIIVSEMIRDRELDKALNAVPKVYALKRKKIHLDRDAIQQAHEKHSGTVELLNEYLRDEYEDDSNTFKIEEVSAAEMVMEITPKFDIENKPVFISGITLTQVQCELLELFVKENLAVHHHEAEAFARSKGVLKNQLIDSLNEACYDTLDDLLVEEEDEYYTISQNYYETILAK